MRTEVLQLKKIGRMPNQSADDNQLHVNRLLEAYDEIFYNVEEPITLEEGQALILLFPDKAFYDLEWDLVRLIENLEGKIENSLYEELISKCPSEKWREILIKRYMNGKSQSQ